MTVQGDMKQSEIEIQMHACRLCPRGCGVDRLAGERGICGQGSEIRAARAALHKWEEPCISGRYGSGAVFFSGCGLGCVYCQNRSIAVQGRGHVISMEHLAEIFLRLQEEGANNINLVTACQFVPQVIASIERARDGGLRLPIVYNSSGYESLSTIQMLEGYVDIYLPDLKYMDREMSRRYSHAADYFEKASKAIHEMVRQTKELLFTDEETRSEKLGIDAYQERSGKGESLLMTKGVIVRHLLLPGCLEDARRIVSWLLSSFGERIFISLMNQYTPMPCGSTCLELDRKVDREEYEALVDYAISLGIENGFIQEGETARESFIPEFDGTGIL